MGCEKEKVQKEIGIKLTKNKIRWNLFFKSDETKSAPEENFCYLKIKFTILVTFPW